MAAESLTRVPEHGPKATTVTYARMLNLIVYGHATADLFKHARGQAEILAFEEIQACRAVQLWQLGPVRWAVVWIDVGRDGVTVYPEHGMAVDHYQRAVADLQAKEPWTTKAPRPHQRKAPF